MAALGPAFTQHNSTYNRVCAHCAFRTQRRTCTFFSSRTCTQQLRAERSYQRHCKLFHQRTCGVRAQAASDIALPGKGGHAEDIVLPEPGLLNPSLLNSEYDSEIIGLAVPALGSILLDPFMSLVDTGQLRLKCLLHANLCS